MKQNEIHMGSVHIHKKVIAEIVETAIKDIKGVFLSEENLTKKFFSFMYKDHFPSVDISVDENQEVVLGVKINVHFGLNIPDVARQVQDIVKRALDETVNVEIKDINVNIQGIERGQK
ncbi:MAG: Asp23/Gls24 family envelope stress response protein [Candidatus Omnitrophica bacterium]|nr:Asp23/Gls24 family envelope stress response protein [Candidatus Omnitrophota bacterium]